MRKLFLTAIVLICLAATVVSAAMGVMAVRFMEYGRVLFYFTSAIVCIEVALVAAMKLKKSSNQES